MDRGRESWRSGRQPAKRTGTLANLKSTSPARPALVRLGLLAWSDSTSATVHLVRGRALHLGSGPASRSRSLTPGVERCGDRSPAGRNRQRRCPLVGKGSDGIATLQGPYAEFVVRCDGGRPIPVLTALLRSGGGRSIESLTAGLCVAPACVAGPRRVSTNPTQSAGRADPKVRFGHADRGPI
jgi:hypothetical protein